MFGSPPWFPQEKVVCPGGGGMATDDFQGLVRKGKVQVEQCLEAYGPRSLAS